MQTEQVKEMVETFCKDKGLVLDSISPKNYNRYDNTYYTKVYFWVLDVEATATKRANGLSEETAKTTKSKWLKLPE